MGMFLSLKMRLIITLILVGISLILYIFNFKYMKKQNKYYESEEYMQKKRDEAKEYRESLNENNTEE